MPDRNKLDGRLPSHTFADMHGPDMGLIDWYAAPKEVFLESGFQSAVAFVRLFPEKAEAHINLAREYRLRGATAYAAQALEEAVEREPQSVGAYLELADLFIDVYRHNAGGAAAAERAIAALQALLLVQPDYHHAYLEIGKLQLLLGDEAGARFALGRYAAQEPAHAQGHYWLGVACHESGDVDVAEDCFKRCLCADPNYADAHFRLAQIYAGREENEAAREALKRSAELLPFDAEITDACRKAESFRADRGQGGSRRNPAF